MDLALPETHTILSEGYTGYESDYIKPGPLSFEQTVSDQSTQLHFKMFQYMLRADPSIRIRDVRGCYWEQQEHRTIKRILYDGHINWNLCPLDVRLKEHFLPPCLTESVPSLLRHCRYCIREVMMKTRTLPDGIYQLPIPTLLHRFLDLLED